MLAKMPRYILKFYLFVILLFCANKATSYNVEIRDEDVKFFYSPVIRATPGANGLPLATESSYYGYKLRFTNGASPKSLFISAPKMTNSAVPQEQTNSTNESLTAEGTVEKCGVSFTGEQKNCTSARLPGVEPGDAFGISMDVDENTLKACSPAKVYNCTSSVSTPGFCYESTDEGRSWTVLKDKPEPVCPIRNLDIIFVLDGSGSVGSDFETVKNWTARMAQEFDIENGTAQIGVIQYSHWDSRISDLNKQPNIKTEVALGQYETEDSLTDAIYNIEYQGFTTSTSHALNKTVLDFQASNRAEDKSMKRVLILLTDGMATDAEFLPQSADYARSNGIVTFAVGVGNYVERELRTIATGNLSSSERVFSVREFSGLGGIVNSLRGQILSLVLEGSGSDVSTTFHMEQAQEGISLVSSSDECGIQRRNLSETGHFLLSGGTHASKLVSNRMTIFFRSLCWRSKYLV